MNLFILLKPNTCKCKKKTSQTEVHTTEISQSRHDREAGHPCGMTKKKRHLVINLWQSEDETPLNSTRI